MRKALAKHESDLKINLLSLSLYTYLPISIYISRFLTHSFSISLFRPSYPFNPLFSLSLLIFNDPPLTISISFYIRTVQRSLFVINGPRVTEIHTHCDAVTDIYNAAFAESGRAGCWNSHT